MKANRKSNGLKISVLRLDHRKKRDKRITTHVALAARAFGATEFVYSGEKDDGLEESVMKVAESWGGKFSARHEKKPLQFAKKFKGEKVHLTFYGKPLSEFLSGLGNGEPKGKLLAIVGGSKVPREFYFVGKNVSVTNQPHSEVSSLAILLTGLNPFWESLEFSGWKRRIIPSETGKVVKTSKPEKNEIRKK